MILLVYVCSELEGDWLAGGLRSGGGGGGMGAGVCWQHFYVIKEGKRDN